MLKRLQNAVAIAAFTGLVLGLGHEEWRASSRQPSEQKVATQCSYGDDGHMRHCTFGDWVSKDAAGFFTFWLVLVGFGQAGLFMWQLMLIRSQMNLMRDGIEDARIAAVAAQAAAITAKEQVAVTKMGIIDLERAYLAVAPTSIQWNFKVPAGRGYSVPNDPREVTVLLAVTNTGRTFATIVKIYGEFSRSPPKGDVPTYSHGTAVQTDLALMAGESEALSPFEFKDDFADPQFFWGYIEYRDIFKNIRTARFCTFILPEGYPAAGKVQIAGSDGWRECD